MVSDVSVKTSIFQPCSFIKSLIYPGTFKEERESLSLSVDANWQFMGRRGRDQGPGETSGRREGGLSFVYFLCPGLQPHKTTCHP